MRLILSISALQIVGNRCASRSIFARSRRHSAVSPCMMRLVRRRKAPESSARSSARKSVLGEPAHPLRQIEGVAGEDDLKFDLVMEMRLGEQAIDVVIHQTPGEIVGYVARYEGVEADAHVDVGQSVKADQQRKTAQILVPVIVPLIGPDRVGDEFAIERQRERARAARR